MALGMTVLVHLVGVAALIWLLISAEDGRPDWRGWWPGGDDDEPRRPDPGPTGGGLPLPDAVPSDVRLREPARLADGYPVPTRRPAHAPERAPHPVGDR